MAPAAAKPVTFINTIFLTRVSEDRCLFWSLVMCSLTVVVVSEHIVYENPTIIVHLNFILFLEIIPSFHFFIVNLLFSRQKPVVAIKSLRLKSRRPNNLPKLNKKLPSPKLNLRLSPKRQNL